MFVHRKRNKSGSFSIIVKQKGRHSRANKVVKIIGTSSDEGELLELERRGWEYIDSLRGFSTGVSLMGLAIIMCIKVLYRVQGYEKRRNYKRLGH